MSLQDRVRAYITNLRQATASASGWSEDQLKRPVCCLIEEAGRERDMAVHAPTEYIFPGLRSRPDIGVEIHRPGPQQELFPETIGFVELKAPGLGARPDKLKGGHAKTQWEALKVFDNVVYTDGLEWAHYRKGECSVIGHLGSTLLRDHDAVPDPQGVAAVAQILTLLLEPKPIVPADPRSLAELLAPKCRLLRDAVRATLNDPNSALVRQADDWRDLLFADADDDAFADAYAQTVTYALLLARLDGLAPLTLDGAMRRLDATHSLMGRALKALTDIELATTIRVPIDLLLSSIAAVDPERLRSKSKGRDPWLYFYEDFLAAYDSALRKSRGVYYTPIEVVGAQLALVADLLRTELGKDEDFADDSVQVLDPAAGTGTYLHLLLTRTLDRLAERYGDAGNFATSLAKRVFGFELLVGPYAVAHLRLSEAVRARGGNLPRDGANVYLGDTLEAAEGERQLRIPVILERLARERVRVRDVKRQQRVLVCLGNPPYHRETKVIGEGYDDRKGGWVRFGPNEGPDGVTRAPILDDYLAPARAVDAGVHLKSLYNDYVYFWRWATWKVLEQSGGPGIVAFITASSFLRGPGFVGMREHLRRSFDELLVLDLEGEGLGAVKTENVFDIRTPVCITIGLRRGPPCPETPARLRYARISGTREEKFARLAAIERVDDIDWQQGFEGWHEPLLAHGAGDWFGWPKLVDVFPWTHTGAEFQRTWPISASDSVLERRWTAFLAARDRAAVFSENRDRKVDRAYAPLVPGQPEAPPLAKEPADAPVPLRRGFAFRSFDRARCLADSRLGTVLKRALWVSASREQVFLTGMFTKVLGRGPALVACAHIPDRDHFSGRGGKDVIPLWRDAAATQPNVTAGLLNHLATAFGRTVTAPELYAYAYALLAQPAYTARFAEELTIPGPRLPLTKDGALFARGAALGSELLRWHTYGERFRAPGDGFVLTGSARCRVAVPDTEDGYPEKADYDPETGEIALGTGRFGPVAPDVWGYEVSGLRVVQSWLGYRMKGGAGRKSSPLDDIREKTWPAAFTKELLELLWVLEHSVATHPEQAALLEAVLKGPLWLATELPQPTEAEREPPKTAPPAVQPRLL